MNATISGPLHFGFNLTTHRDKDLDGDATSFFQYECIIAAISVAFFRTTIKSHHHEPLALRLFSSLTLAGLAFVKKPYEIICAMQMFSYAVPLLLKHQQITRSSVPPRKLNWLLLVALSACLSLAISHFVLSDDFFAIMAFVTPSVIKNLVFYLIPIYEMQQAYDIITQFVDPDVLQKQLSHLLFVTFNIQVGIGYLGIEFLKREQRRRNELVRLDMTNDPDATAPTENGPKPPEELVMKQKDASRRFQRGAAPFILMTATPYMFQLIAYGNVNMFAFACLQDDIHRAVRLNQLFKNDSHLVAMANDSATSPEAYAQSMDEVVNTIYDLVNRKFFSLPKLMLLPGIMMRQPLLVAQITPFIFGSDFINAKILAFLTTSIEKYKKESMEIQSVRSKVESFDMKNADLLQRSGVGATAFTQKKWEELTVSIQQKTFMASLLTRTKRFFNWIQHHFVFSVMIDCALAQLIAAGKIVSAEIFVFSRAIEDAVDTVLMRSRAESELARMLTQIDKLKELASAWEKSRSRLLLPCLVSPHEVTHSGIVLKNLHYSRGSASVSVDHLNIDPGVYALTGANGSGKSTLFRVLMSCQTNVKSTDLPSSITFASPSRPIIEEADVPDDACSAIDEICPPPDENAGRHPKLEITLPSSDVAEISQSFYWPLYTRPIDWIYQTHLSDKDAGEKARVVAELLQDLEFRQIKRENTGSIANESQAESTSVDIVMDELQETKDDWFNDLSGGQKSKVELVRKVFLHDSCPSVLLIDETMAPLDPTSKGLVMSKLKAFCHGSVVIVIYHTDVTDDDGGVECVPGNNFFDANLHLENRTLKTRPLCS
ncbi:hypothetical protein MHU86_25973 [Fragilaria crotonensis]|nr:hypothetical protein MHU86_25973 [Fragilaria crotonensis]